MLSLVTRMSDGIDPATPATPFSEKVRLTTVGFVLGADSVAVTTAPPLLGMKAFGAALNVTIDGGLVNGPVTCCGEFSTPPSNELTPTTTRAEGSPKLVSVRLPESCPAGITICWPVVK